MAQFVPVLSSIRRAAAVPDVTMTVRCAAYAVDFYARQHVVLSAY